MRKLLALTLTILVAAFVVSRVTPSTATPHGPGDPTVTTDKTDYQPGETVVISGSGFAAGETVNITLSEDPAKHADTSLSATADEYGNFANKDFSPTEENVGTTFHLTATGAASGRSASATFTDGGSFSYSPASTTLNFQSTTSSQSAQFNQSLTAPANNGSFTATLTTIGVPAGWSVTASPSPLSFTTGTGGTAHTDTKTWTITVTIPANTATGSYSITLKANPSVSGMGSGAGTILTVNVQRDDVAPNSSLSATAGGNPYGGNYTNQNVIITLNATDSGTPTSGVASTQYKIDSGSYQPYTVPFTISTEGVQVITYLSTDVQGNVESGKTFTVRIDKTKPVITLNGAAEMTVSLGSGPFSDPGASATDAGGSGLNGSVTTSDSVDTNTVGDYTLHYEVSDNAGNAADIVTRLVHVVKADQTIDFGPLADKVYGDPDFDVTAKAGSGDPVTFTASGDCSLSGSTVHITSAGSCTITAHQPGNANYNAAPDVLRSFNIAKASATVNVTPYSVTYDANPHTATGTATGVNSEDLSALLDLSGTTHTGAGTYNGDAWSFAGDANYSSASGTVNDAIAKAPSSVSIDCTPGQVYTGAALEPCTASVTGAGGLSESLTVSYTDNINAGTASASASFAGDSNHFSSSDTKSFTIDKAASATALTFEDGPYAYRGSAFTASAVTTGAGGLNSPVSVVYSGDCTNVTSENGCTATATFDGDSNHNGSTDSKSITITKAPSVTDVTCTGGPFTYTGAAIEPCSASVTGAGGLNLTPSPVYASNVNAGTASASYSFAGDANHDGSSDSENFTIGKAASVTTLTCGAGPFTYTGSPVEPCSASVTGAGGLNESLAVAYADNISAGTATASASFAGDSNHEASSDSTTFAIGKASSVTTVTCPPDETYTGSAIEPCTASATGAGSLNQALTVSYADNINVGTATASASFAGDANHEASSGSATFAITKAAATISLSNLSQTYDGTPKSATASTNPSGLSVTITYAPASQAGHGKNTASGNPVNAGSYTVTATIDDPNYEGSASDTLVISKADATVSVSGYTGTYDGSAHGATGTATGAQGEDLASLLDFGASYTNVPGGTAHWTFNASNTNTNYNTASGDVQITISKATPSITWNNPANITYGTALSGTQLNATASTAGTFSYTPSAGTVLSSGNGQNLHVNFTPTDSTNYNAASADVSINVLSAVLSVSMTADRTSPVPVGTNFNYKPVITNTGNAPATGVTLTDTLPTQVTFTTASASQGTCSYNSTTRTVTCNVGTIAAGSSVNIQITVKPRDEGTLNNSVTVTGGQWDPATGNSSASVNGLQSQKIVDLSVSKTDSVDPIFVGDQTTYTMVVKNSNTTINATGVSLTDSLPSGMTFVSGTTSQGTLVTPPVGSTGIVTASIGTVAPNATVTVTVTVKGAAAGVQVNTASVSSNETDSNSSNNTATQSTTVKAVVVVSLQKVLLAKQVMTGGCETTTGQVYLTAPAPAGGVSVMLSSNISGVSVPQFVDIAAGAMVSPNFNVQTNPVSAKQTGLVTATSGPNSVSRGVTINVGNGTCP